MITPARYNFPSIRNNDTFGRTGAEWTITLNQDIDAGTIAMKFKKQGASSVSKTLASGTEITILDTATGQFKINKQVLTFSEGAGFYDYDIQVTLSGDIYTYVVGTIEILPDL